MSTKDISRSAVEGGRTNTSERNESHRRERSRSRVWLDRVRFDLEISESSVPPARTPVRKAFTDRLRPCWGWLASRSGRRWSEVYSELTAVFDTRKLSAWHIVHQHMLREVRGAGTSSDGDGWPTKRFYIDDAGVLRDHGRRPADVRFVKPDPAREQAIAKVAGRKVVAFDRVQFWAVPSSPEWKPCHNPKHCHLQYEHRVVDRTPPSLVEMYTTGSHRSFRDSPHWRALKTEHLAPTWRMAQRFTPSETAWWSTLAPWLQQSFLRDFPWSV